MRSFLCTVLLTATLAPPAWAATPTAPAPALETPPSAPEVALDTPSAGSGQALGPPLVLSLEEALRRGEAHAPELLRATAAVQQARARQAGAAVLLPNNPLATLMIGLRREDQPEGPPATGLQFQVHLEQAIEIAGQRGARLRAVEAAVAAAQARGDFARSETRALLRLTYVAALLADARVGVVREQAAIAERLLRSARDRATLGASGDIETNLALIESGRINAEVTDARARHQARLAELRALIGLPQTQALSLSTPLSGPPRLDPDLRDLPAVLQRAAEHRADLRAVRQQGRELDAERSRLRREVAPNPILALDIQRDLPGQIFYGGTVGLQLPLWNRNQGPLAQVRAAEQARRTEEAVLLRRAHAEVAQAYRALLLRRDQAQRFRDVALPPAQRNVDLLQRGWQAGKFDLFRVIAALRELSETRLRYLTILDDLWLAAIELERAVGAPLLPGGNP